MQNSYFLSKFHSLGTYNVVMDNVTSSFSKMLLILITLLQGFPFQIEKKEESVHSQSPLWFNGRAKKNGWHMTDFYFTCKQHVNIKFTEGENGWISHIFMSEPICFPLPSNMWIFSPRIEIQTSFLFLNYKLKCISL